MLLMLLKSGEGRPGWCWEPFCRQCLQIIYSRTYHFTNFCDYQYIYPPSPPPPSSLLSPLKGPLDRMPLAQHQGHLLVATGEAQALPERYGEDRDTTTTTYYYHCMLLLLLYHLAYGG